MNVPIGDPKAPGIAGALEYLEARYGVPAGHIRDITITGGVNQPTVITVALLVQSDAVGQRRPDADTVTFLPGCLCPRNAAGRIGTDPRCPMHQPGAAGLGDAATEVNAITDPRHGCSCWDDPARLCRVHDVEGERMGGR